MVDVTWRIRCRRDAGALKEPILIWCAAVETSGRQAGRSGLHEHVRPKAEPGDELVPALGPKRSTCRLPMAAAVVLIGTLGGMVSEEGNEIEIESSPGGKVDPA